MNEINLATIGGLMDFDVQSKSKRCLFCLGDGPFNTIEHIIPESLGNDDLFIKGLVCDGCQRYLGTNIEKLVLEKTPFAFWRVFQGIKTKKRKLPSVDLTPPAKGILPARHHFGQYDIGFTAHDDLTVSIDVNTPQAGNMLLANNSYFLVLTPWHINIIGRFLGKMGLELLAISDPDKAFSEKFDPLRRYVREGVTSWVWPFYLGQYGEIGDLKSEFRFSNGAWEQDIFCYTYTLGITNKDEYFFAFNIGIDLYLLCL